MIYMWNVVVGILWKTPDSFFMFHDCEDELISMCRGNESFLLDHLFCCNMRIFHMMDPDVASCVNTHKCCVIQEQQGSDLFMKYSPCI